MPDLIDDNGTWVLQPDKDLADLVQLAHKMRIDEIKAQTDMEKAKAQNVKNQTNVQINGEVPFGQGNYGELMKKLLKEPTSDV